MPIQDPSAEYLDKESSWTKINDCLAGQDRMKKQAKNKGLYLVEMGTGQFAEAKSDPLNTWHLLVNNLTYTNYPLQMLHHYVGAAFEKGADTNLTNEFLGKLFGMDLNSLNDLTREVYIDHMTTGNTGIYLDVNPITSFVTPTVIHGASVLDTRYEHGVLTEVRIMMTIPDPEEDRWTNKTVNSIWHLYIEDGKAYRDTYIQPANSIDYQLIDSQHEYKRGGQNIGFIPFISIRGQAKIELPLEDIANWSISHMNILTQSAYYLNQANLTQLVATGVDPDEMDAAYKAGVGAGWIFSGADAKVTAVDLAGPAAGNNDQAIKTSLEIGASIGVTGITSTGAGAISAEALHIKNRPTTVKIEALTLRVSRAIKKTIDMMHLFTTGRPINEDVIYALLTRHERAVADSAMLGTMIDGVRSGGLDVESLVRYMSAHDLVTEDQDPIEVAENIRKSIPAVAPVVPSE